MNTFKTLLSVSFIAIISRMLGFVRDATIAYIFGAGILVDSFLVAFKFPNLLRRIFAEGALYHTLVPVLVEHKKKYGDASTKEFLSNISGLLIIILTLIISLGSFASPFIITIVAPGYAKSINKLNLSSKILKILLIYILFISLSSLCGVILNINNNYSASSFTPIILNISMIFFTLIISRILKIKITLLAWSVIVGGILQLLYNLFFIKKINMIFIPKLKVNLDNNLIQVVKLMCPAILGMSIGQISTIINTIFASYMISGSISWTYYADRLIEFPSGVINIILSNIILPLLSKSYSNKDNNEYSYIMNKGIKLCLVLSVPSMIILILLAKPIIITLYQYGNFTINDALMTEYSLIAQSVGLVSTILTKILSICFYSRKDISTPLKISIITLILTQIINIFLINLIKHIGLSLSSGISSYINLFLLIWFIYKKKMFTIQNNELVKFIIKLIFSSIIMSIYIFIILSLVKNWIFNNLISRLIKLFLVILSCVLINILSLKISGIKISDLII